jgi:hypothetical protein
MYYYNYWGSNHLLVYNCFWSSLYFHCYWTGNVGCWLREKVDVIISEWMGYMLLYEVFFRRGSFLLHFNLLLLLLWNVLFTGSSHLLIWTWFRGQVNELNLIICELVLFICMLDFLWLRLQIKRLSLKKGIVNNKRKLMQFGLTRNLCFYYLLQLQTFICFYNLHCSELRPKH